VGQLADQAAIENGGVSAPAAGEPGGALDRGMRIVLRRDWRWLRCRPCLFGWRNADAHNDPISVALCGDPAGAGICSSPSFDLSQGLVTCHWHRIVPSRLRGNQGRNVSQGNSVTVDVKQKRSVAERFLPSYHLDRVVLSCGTVPRLDKGDWTSHAAPPRSLAGPW